MAFAPSKSMRPSMGLGMGGATQPDPLLQPALSNAMRLGRTFTQLSAQRGQGVAQPAGPGTMPQAQPQGRPF